MSKNNNVIPGQYKVHGRERHEEDIVPEVHKAKYMRNRENEVPKRKSSRPKAPARPSQ